MEKIIRILTSIVITALVSIMCVYFFLNIYEKNTTSNFKRDDTTANGLKQLNDTSKLEYKINELIKELDELKNNKDLNIQKDSSAKTLEKTVEEEEIRGTIFATQKYIYSTKNKKLSSLIKYRKKLTEYYKVKGLNDSINFQLKTTINSIDIELSKIDKIKNDNDSISTTP